MGTNYYLYVEEPCPTCGKGGEPMHIGKASAGWCFSLCVYPDETPPITTLGDWEDIFSTFPIKDEYGADVTPEEMLRIITERSTKPRGEGPWSFSGRPATWEEYLRVNGAEFGPNNLLRGRIGEHTVGHGEGTWDYCTPNFS